MRRRKRVARFLPQDLTAQAMQTPYPLLNTAVKEYLAAGWRVFAINCRGLSIVVCMSKTFGNVGGIRSAVILPNGRFEPARGHRATWNWSAVDSIVAAMQRKAS
jgi:hypothetical protein